MCIWIWNIICTTWGDWVTWLVYNVELNSLLFLLWLACNRCNSRFEILLLIRTLLSNWFSASLHFVNSRLVPFYRWTLLIRLPVLLWTWLQHYLGPLNNCRVVCFAFGRLRWLLWLTWVWEIGLLFWLVLVTYIK